MKSKLTSVIMSIIMILIVVILGIFGILVFEEISGVNTASEVEKFVSDAKAIADSATNEPKKEDIKTPSIIESKIGEILNATNTQSKETDKNEEVNYSNINVNKYFYNQLEETSKIMYNAFEANKEQMKTGIYQIDFGTAFSDLLSTSGGEKKLGEYYQSAIEAYTYDNPDIFYLAPTKMYLNIETTTKRNKTTYKVFINQGNQGNYLAEGYYSKEQIDTAIAKIQSVRDQLLSQKTGNQFKDIKLVHDYLVDQTEDDSTISKDNIYNIYGTLVQKMAVCEGYAKSFKYLMDAFEIPCTMVIGKATNSQGQTENHAWNYVQIRQKWYAIDCTWDDPVVIGGGKATMISRYKYFLKGSNDLSKDHVASGQFTDDGKMFEYPVLNASAYEY